MYELLYIFSFYKFHLYFYKIYSTFIFKKNCISVQGKKRPSVLELSEHPHIIKRTPGSRPRSNSSSTSSVNSADEGYSSLVKREEAVKAKEEALRTREQELLQREKELEGLI